MPLTIFLAKVLGISLVIIGAALLIRRDYYVSVFGTFVEQRLTRVVLAIIELVAALALVMAHTVWSPLPAAIITLFGWIAAIEAAAYLVLPDNAIAALFARFNTPGWYLFGGVLAIALGAYLSGFGFGWW